MSELARQGPSALVHPITGEILEADAAGAAQVLRACRDQREKLLEYARLCEDILRAESETQGKKTLRLGGYKVELRGDSEIQWDLEILDELLDVGLPTERYRDLIKEEVVHTYKVRANVAKQIEAANEKYAEIIGRARKRIDKPGSVKVARP